MKISPSSILFDGLVVDMTKVAARTVSGPRPEEKEEEEAYNGAGIIAQDLHICASPDVACCVKFASQKRVEICLCCMGEIEETRIRG